MSNVHEESLLSESLSLEDVNEGCVAPASIYDNDHLQKFGIVNVSKDEHASGDDAEKTDKEVSLFCNTFPSLSTSGETKQDGQGAITSTLPDSQLSVNVSNSDVHDISSSSCSGLDETNEQNVAYSTNNVDSTSNVMALLDATIISQNPSTVTKNWVLFDDAGSPQNDVFSVSPTTINATSQPIKPPDIPRRKGLLSTEQSIDYVNISSPPPCVVSEHFVKSKATPSSDVPPIPKRLLTPRKTLPVAVSTTSSDFRIPPPPISANSSLKRHSHSRSSASSISYDSVKSPTVGMLGPPIPPRKDIVKRQIDQDSISDLSRASETSSLQGWIRFEQAGSSQDELLDNGSICTTRTTPSQYFISDDIRSSLSSLNAESSIIDTSSAQKELEVGNSATWITPSSPESPKSTKKKKKGYHHLSSGSDEEEDASSVLAGDEITIEVTDLSPAKPLSRWAIMLNEAEEKSGSSGDISARNSMLDPHDDLDLEDAFGLTEDRLSTDGSGLKGFNRADKGSQNNLVDFSLSAEQLDNSTGEDDGSSENELETVFDMTAQGDSLKRKRKKKGIRDSPPSPLMHNSNSSVTASAMQDASVTLESNTETKPFNQSTNPFWRHSPIGDTISMASSTSESNPFDRVQFQSAMPTTSSTPLAKTPKLGVSAIPTLPPPPKSTKPRSLSSSFGRPRPLNEPAPRSFSTSRSRTGSEDHKRASSASSSVHESKMESSVGTPMESDSISLLDVAEEVPSLDEPLAAQKDSVTSLQRHDDVTDAKVSKVVEEAGTSGTIYETALQILDVDQCYAPVTPPSISVEKNTDVTAHPVLTEYPNLSQNSLKPLEELLKTQIADGHCEAGADVEHLTRLKKDYLVSFKSEWEMLMRFPRVKHVMSSRKWVAVHVKIKLDKVEHPSLQLFHNSSSAIPFFFIPLYSNEYQLSCPTLQPRFQSTSDARRGSTSAEGLNPDSWRPEMRKVAYYSATKRKVHCVKVLRIHYKEKRSFTTKADKYMSRMPSGFKHSVKKKQVAKLGTEDYADLMSFLLAMSDASFKANSVRKNEDEEHRTTVNYHSKDEVMFQINDEFIGSVSSSGIVESCDVIVHVFVTSFLSGDPLATVTFNNKKVEGKEVVRRSDIIPSSNNNWIDMSDIEVHRCSPRGFEEETAAITFHPPDACRFELARFHSTYVDKEPPIIVRPSVSVQRHRVTLRCVMRSSAKQSENEDLIFQVPCEDVCIRFPIPESWIPAFRRVSLGNYKSIHASRMMKQPLGRAKVLGGAKVTRCHAAIEASVGSGKYEAAYNALVWRIKRVPEKNAALNAPQVFKCVMDLESDHPYEGLELEDCHVEYTMPGCTASDACVRSVTLPNSPRAEKFTCYSAHYLYRVKMALNREEDASDCTVQ